MDEDEAARLERKRLKKLRKQEKKRALEEEEQDGEETTAAAGEVVEEKKKKNKKAKVEEEDEPVEVVMQEEEVVDEEERKKRAKKEKKRLRKLAEQASSMEQQEEEEEVVAAKSSSSSKGSAAKKSGGGGGGSASSGNYVEHEATFALTSSEVEAHRKASDIEVFPVEEAPALRPILSFDHLSPSLRTFCPAIGKYITAKAFKNPSPIQSQCWPPLLQGRDVIGIAATGSGKTLTFLIPALLKIAKAGPIKGKLALPSPRVLVVAPTRELAMQSQQVCEDVGACRSVVIYGGVPKPVQKSELRAGAEVVVATPGRLIDLLDEGVLSLGQVCYLVLDEADRMLDDGFEPAMRRILSDCPKSTSEIGRQTVMFSATWPPEIRDLASRFLRSDVIRVTVGGQELSANHRVQQIVECIEKHNRDKRLLTLLGDYHKSRSNRCLIFILYKREATTLLSFLQSKGFNATAIHGDKSQPERSAALEDFKKGKIPLLIATDVAARGLDIPQVEYVINYSFPLTVEDYVHRIGRTGRGGASGIAHTFFTDDDKGLAGALVGVLQEAGQPVPPAILKYPLITKKKTSKLYGDFGPKPELAEKKATKITFDD